MLRIQGTQTLLALAPCISQHILHICARLSPRRRGCFASYPTYTSAFGLDAVHAATHRTHLQTLLPRCRPLYAPYATYTSGSGVGAVHVATHPTHPRTLLASTPWMFCYISNMYKRFGAMHFILLSMYKQCFARHSVIIKLKHLLAGLLACFIACSHAGLLVFWLRSLDISNAVQNHVYLYFSNKVTMAKNETKEWECSWSLPRFTDAGLDTLNSGASLRASI